jgi:hypothetical protein
VRPDAASLEEAQQCEREAATEANRVADTPAPSATAAATLARPGQQGLSFGGADENESTRTGRESSMAPH